MGVSGECARDKGGEQPGVVMSRVMAVVCLQETVKWQA